MRLMMVMPSHLSVHKTIEGVKNCGLNADLNGADHCFIITSSELKSRLAVVSYAALAAGFKCGIS